MDHPACASVFQTLLRTWDGRRTGCPAQVRAFLVGEVKVSLVMGPLYLGVPLAVAFHHCADVARTTILIPPAPIFAARHLLAMLATADMACVGIWRAWAGRRREKATWCRERPLPRIALRRSGVLHASMAGVNRRPRPATIVAAIKAPLHRVALRRVIGGRPSCSSPNHAQKPRIFDLQRQIP